MFVRVDDWLFELPDDEKPDAFRARAEVSMQRHEVWQVHPVDQAPVTVNWPAVRVLAVWE